MNATIELTADEWADLRELTSEHEAGAALRIALSEYVRFARRMRLKELSGRVEMEDDWRDLEAAER